MATDGFEESELFGPREILMRRGAEVRLASPSLSPIQATVHDDPGKVIRPDLTIGQASGRGFRRAAAARRRAQSRRVARRIPRPSR